LNDISEQVYLNDDGASGEVHRLQFENRTLHRLLSEAPADGRPGLARDALELGAEVLARLSYHGDLDQVAGAIDRLDAEGKRIIETTMTASDKVVSDTITNLREQLSAEDGPFADLVNQFNPAVEGNVVETFRDLVSSTIAKATRLAVNELAETTTDQVQSLTKSTRAFAITETE
jgi:hypothetical protein